MEKIMLKDFIDQPYLIIENNIVVNIVIWNGDTSIWTPPQGSIALISATTPAKIWQYDSDLKQWNLTEMMGASDIGFTWDGTYCITNEPKPTITGIVNA